MEDRRYRQPGYKDSAKERQDKSDATHEFATRATLQSQTISRCADCGTELPALTDPLGQCPKCKSALHSCVQCAHFDRSQRFECTQPVPARIPDKHARNDCTFFSLRATVERISTGGAARPEDPRRAFENLFKKK